LALFKANCFFRNFDILGGGDRILIYLILYIQECLVKLSKLPDPVEGQKLLATLAVSNFPLPGDAKFPMNNMFEKPANRSDAGNMKLMRTFEAILYAVEAGIGAETN
jgi:actin related protein 2/3 complex, subunit 3